MIKDIALPVFVVVFVVSFISGTLSAVVVNGFIALGTRASAGDCREDVREP